MINVKEHLTQWDNEEAEEPIIHCWYNYKENHYMEYYWDKTIGMYKYEIAGEYGPFQQGYIGSVSKDLFLAKHWICLGTL